jgi:hypothetical protein
LERKKVLFSISIVYLPSEKRKKGFEPSTLAMARQYSTIELLPLEDLSRLFLESLGRKNHSIRKDSRGGLRSLFLKRSCS